MNSHYFMISNKKLIFKFKLDKWWIFGSCAGRCSRPRQCRYSHFHIYPQNSSSIFYFICRLICPPFIFPFCLRISLSLSTIYPFIQTTKWKTWNLSLPFFSYKYKNFIFLFKNKKFYIIYNNKEKLLLL